MRTLRAVIPLISVVSALFLAGCEKEYPQAVRYRANEILAEESRCGENMAKASGAEEDRLREENYALQIKVKELQDYIKTNVALCNVQESLQRDKEDRAAREAQRRQKEAQLAQEASDKEARLRQALRTGRFTETEWKKLLLIKSKQEVVNMIGSPQAQRKPVSSGELLWEYWTYFNKVKLEERPNEFRTLVVVFENGSVSAVHTEASTKGM